MKTTILLTIEHAKEVPEITNMVAGRVYTFMKNYDRTAEVEAKIVQPLEVKEME